MPKIESQICSDFLKDYDTIIKVTEELNGELVPISELFDYVTGFSSANVKRYAKNEEGNLIPFIRPSKTQYTSIDAYVDPNEVDDNMIFPEGTLYVSTDGEGSHTYAYVSITPFVPNSNTVVLLPKRDMPTKEKLFYALAITKNRYRFSYGRKPKGERFFNINVPKYPPRYVNNCIF
ncbi:MAG TPA: hypothetical protein HA349_02385 [Methanotrichaceae archaeon]|nr:hypothetical protein [Methanotrichaceae archaeon]